MSERKQTDEAPEAPETPETPEAPTDLVEQQIPIDQIALPDNHRVKEAANKAKLEELRELMAAAGQLQAIKVCRAEAGPGGAAPTPPYVLVYGFRRLEAARQLGWQTIRAVVSPPMGPAQMERDRATENLGRQDLNPIEECLAVEALVDRCGGDVARAAWTMGRSETWIRDRLYLQRLAKPVRKLVIEGHLLLGHARELVKVGDKKEQQEIAERACASWGHGFHGEGHAQRWSVDELRRHVEASKRSLKSVPWELGEKVGRKPPCIGCPDNSATDEGLFGLQHEEKVPGYCMNRTCFEKKQHEAERAKEKVAEKAKKAGDASAATVDRVKPKWLKKGPAQRAAKKAVPGSGAVSEKSNGKAKAGASRGGGSPYADSPMMKAKREFSDASRDYRQQLAPQVMEAAKADPHRLIALTLLVEAARLDDTGRFIATWEDKPPEEEPPIGPETDELIRRLERCEPEDLVALARKWIEDGDTDDLEWSLMRSGENHLRRVAEVLGLEPPDAPKWEDFDPAAKKEEEEKGAAEPAGGKKKSSKKKGAKKKGAKKKKAAAQVSAGAGDEGGGA